MTPAAANFTAAEVAGVRELAAEHPLAWAMHASGWSRDRKTGLFTPRYQLAPHIRFLGQHLMRIHRGECKRLLVSMPPRHGKTLLTSRFFLGWWLGKHPDHRVITTTYQARLVQRWSRNIRNDLVRCGPEVFGVAASARAAADDWDLLPMRPRRDDEPPVEGGISAVGINGAFTGKGANIVNCDDLVQGAEQVRNPQVRENMWQDFEQEVMTRLEPDAAALVTMTRWHPDDIIGRILRSQAEGRPVGGERWEVINLAALAVEDDPLGRAPGEALWEARFPRKKLERMRDGMSPGAWSALFQGRPTPAEGSLFERGWLRYFDEAAGRYVSDRVSIEASRLLLFVTVDPAWSTKTSADWSVVMTWGLDRQNGRLFLLHVRRGRWAAPRLAQEIRDELQRSGATVAYIEAQNLKLDQMDVLRRSGLPMREIQPNLDKVARFMPVQAWAARGALIFRRGAPWLAELERELLEFRPGCEHDDQVDAISYGVNVANTFRASGIIVSESVGSGARANPFDHGALSSRRARLEADEDEDS